MSARKFTPGVLDELQLGYREHQRAQSEADHGVDRDPRADRSQCEGNQRRRHDGCGDVGRNASIRMAGSRAMRTVRAVDGWRGAAIHRREHPGRAASPTRTGEGCYIDVAQSEAGVQFMMPAYYEFAANGKVPERRGVAGSPLRVPEGVYRCAGWIDGSQSARSEAHIGNRCASIIGGALRESTLRYSAGPASQSR